MGYEARSTGKADDPGCATGHGTSSVGEARFRDILDGIPGLVITAAATGELELFNRPVLEFFGKTPDELRNWTVGGIVYPDDLPRLVEAFTLSMTTGCPYDLEYRLRRFDGVYRWFHGRALPVRDSVGHILNWYFLLTDVEDRRRAETLLASESRLLEMVAGGDSISKILDELCGFVEATVTGSYCSVVLVDSTGTRLEHGAAPSLPSTFVTAIEGRPVNIDSGPCAMAAYLNEQVISIDLALETRWKEYEWCPMALAHGLRSCWSTPISSTIGKVLGAFAIYYKEPRTPTTEDQVLIAQFTHIASIAIERQQSQMSLSRALDELKTSEGRLRTTIDAIPGLVWSAGSDGNVDFLNQAWCDYTGVGLEDAGGSGWAKTLHPEDAGRLTGSWASLMASGEPGEFEARFRRFDGSCRWFLIRAVPLRDETGRIIRWYGLNTDIEDRKQADSLLAGEKRLLERVASGTPLGSILEDLCHFVEATVTSSYCSILLVDPTRTHLQHAAGPSLPINFNASVDGLPLVVTSGPCATAVCLNEQVIAADITLDGRWAEHAWCPMALANGLKACWSTPISCTNGTVIGIFAIYYKEPRTPTPRDQALIGQFTHIASIAVERAQGEAALTRSEAFLAKAQQLSLTGSFSWRVATGEITWSEQAYRIFAFDPALTVTLELIGSRVHPDDIPLMRDMVARAQAGQDFEYEHRLQMQDGSTKYLHMIAHRILDEAGQMEYIGAVQDVTERRLADQALSKVRSELAHVARVTSLGAMTASIAHEVNQPLFGIVNNASTCLRMLAADPPNIEGALETARRTLRDGNRASEVIKRLRALFRKTEAISEPVDLSEAAREVVALSLSDLQRNRVILRSELASNLPHVIGDRVQLQQVILNLLRNASDAMSSVTDRPRQLMIKTEGDEGDRVRLTVQDTGVGLDSQAIDKLFQAFYTTKSSGMGIGLSISRSIIEKHHGSLWAAPNNGPGATFSFSIPRGPGAVTGVDSIDTIQTPVAATKAARFMGNP
ncbi:MULTISPECIES: PAS domain-containing protein [Acidobacteriaceae]|uniref:GAF domain-containing sensor histidine kinase n=1 Tax=Acidobacteriaceae TaxID=204434 RepID=UPI00131E6410|nr:MULTISPECIES: PAS domain-containing protein [Acidobacteriaceae]MDW5267194.1 PAS domain-containing protein [Edaphobacter sp.]